MYRVLAVSGLVLALAVPPAFATSESDVLTACTGSGSTSTGCTSAIAAYANASGKTGAELDKLLGQLAYKLLAGGYLNANTATVIAAALDAIADKVVSTELKTTIGNFADDVEADGDLDTPLPPNPPSANNPSGN